MIDILFILIVGLSLCDAENLTFFQDEYDVKMDIARCAWFNTSVYKYFKADFVPYNRTARVFNGSWEQIQDLQNDQVVHIQIYKMMSNEYRFFPITVSVNTCAEYTKNTFGARDIFFKISTNFQFCDMKRGFRYINNLTPDFSKFPPHLPRGSYKAVANSTYHSYPLYTLEFYVKIVDKPIDWKKIPKRIWN